MTYAVVENYWHYIINLTLCRYASWGGLLPHRPVEDNAFAVARFFQRGGSFHNYYMVNEVR